MSARGVIDIESGGDPLRLALTLGALAELEEELEVESIQAVIDKVATGSMTVTLTMLEAFARAGGAKDAAARVRALDLATAQKALKDLLDANFGGAEAGAGEGGTPGKKR